MHWRRKWQPTPVFLPWRIPWTGEPGGLPSMGSHRVGHDRSDLAAVAAAAELLYDPAIPLQGIYLEKTLILKNTCTPKSLQNYLQ